MVERAIRDLRSGKTIQPLFCKVIVNGDNVTLENKGKDNKTHSILWKDVIYQVEEAIRDETQKNL